MVLRPNWTPAADPGSGVRASGLGSPGYGKAAIGYFASNHWIFLSRKSNASLDEEAYDLRKTLRSI